mmetsp:Transcript_2264/g.3222  ORF Transcript_2264/g.3222 Transcript_2264/m.3222 type:complete len:162 (-) Transcript_2264:11-496(-)|eukprot:CAMPEP_0171456022 /NCGR_PEP_ID=MMETSP0945-20130129/2682_1 /TAXON_ID=109269 /ORGANISM="Vaucheria litorea, Strain CCMP2940" /LENGTH=161 /DNA_ID=CAMNT_0011981377 /DNA_START=1 /DNA_END=486 /DNA_ORIENTATION=+
MPIYVLLVKVELEGVSSLVTVENSPWILDIRSSKDPEQIREGVYISRGDDVEVEGSKGKANFAVKFKGSNSKSTCSVIDIKNYTQKEISAKDSGKFVPIAAFECRGLEIISWHPSTDFIATSEGGFCFGEIDLSEGDWCEYDEENDISVTVTDLEFKIETN